MLFEYKDFKFKTKKEMKEYIRKYMNEKIKDQKTYDIKKDDPIYKLLKKITNNNPDKKELVKEKGIKHFNVCINPVNNKSFHNSIIFKDDTMVDISFLWCVDLINREPPDETQNKINQCLRKSINSQIEEFKKNTKDKNCQICTKNNCEYHVDHIIKFRDLAKEFLSLNLNIPEIENDIINGGSKFKNENDEFITKWQIYHKENAKLRILCKKCNLKLH